MKLKKIKEKEYIKFTKDKAHFLQSYEWGELSKTRNFKPLYVGLYDNNKLVATALLLRKDLLLGYSYYYIPRGFTLDYNDFSLIKEFTLRLKEFLDKKVIFFRIDPDIKLHTIDLNANKTNGLDNYKLVSFLKSIGYKHRKLTYFFETMEPRFTYRIDLDKSVEEIDKNYSQMVRHHIKRANKYKVMVELGNRDSIKEFVRLMKLTESRQNFYSHPDKFYYDFYDIFKDNLTILLASVNLNDIISYLDSEISKNDERKEKLLHEKNEYLKKFKLNEKYYVSAYYMVTYGNKSWYLYGANDLDFKNTCANYKLFDYQIKEAKRLGSTIFDEFGTIGKPNSKSNLVGLNEFKKKWGGEYTEFIGEFDFVLNKFMYTIFKILIPIRHKIIRYKLRKKVK